MRKTPDSAAEVAALSGLPREDLVARWCKIYGTTPPKGVRQDLLVRVIAWHVQAKRLGGVSAETRRLLRSAMNRVESELLARNGRKSISVDHPDKAQGRDTIGPHPSGRAGIKVPRQRRQVTPGARLMRDWNGKTHVVDVIEGGYVFEAKVYPSLTAIAGRITGAHWSGPRFFGL
jgi:hypothetical protein